MPHAATRKRFSTVDAYATEVAWNLARHHHYSPERARRAVNGAEVLVRESYKHGTDPAFLATRLTRGLSSGTKTSGAKKASTRRAGYARGSTEGLLPEALVARAEGRSESLPVVSENAIVCTSESQQMLLSLPADEFDAHEEFEVVDPSEFTHADKIGADVVLAEVREPKKAGARLVSTGAISVLVNIAKKQHPQKASVALDALAKILGVRGPGGRVVVPTKKGVVGRDATWMSGGAMMVEKSGNTKLRKSLSKVAVRVGTEMDKRYRRGVEHRTSTTMTSISGSCPATCALMGQKSDGGRRVGADTSCYALMHQNIGPIVKMLNGVSDRLGLTPDDIARDEANCIDASFRRGFSSPTDLRIHTAGDTRTAAGARAIAAAVRRWQARGGRSAWGYTHAWRDVNRGDWGVVSVLASVQNPSEATEAKRRGWFPTIVVKHGVFGKLHHFGAFKLRGDDTTWIPCPAQNPDKNKQIACVNCRMCMNDQRYVGRNYGIAFEAHGSGGKRAVTFDHGERIVAEMNKRVLGEAQHSSFGAGDVPRRRLPVLK